MQHRLACSSNFFSTVLDFKQTSKGSAPTENKPVNFAELYFHYFV